MSNWQILWWIVFSLIVVFMLIPTFTYIVTKCFYDAKNQSNLTFLQHIHKGKKDEKENVNA